MVTDLSRHEISLREGRHLAVASKGMFGLVKPRDGRRGNKAHDRSALAT